ncbi:MAG: polysaccharide pyruvyl transferase family protein [Ruminococcus sp.]|nr:polysaccharide pyruvyl transferase family protein [Ruminococcus sp.]
MKKICIVTWFDSYNYGTQLQSAALFNYLKQQGLDVYMLGQLRIHKMLLMHPQLLITKIAVKLNEKNRKVFFHPVSYDISEERKKHIAEYVRDNFKVLKIRTHDDWKKVVEDQFIFISGSDIIWQPAMGRPGRMFLDFAAYDGLIRISYASSTGAKTLPKKYYAHYRRVLSGFKAISTREQNSADFFSELLGRPVTKVIDPTLLHDCDFWEKFSAKAQVNGLSGKPFILCYFVMEDSRYWDYVQLIHLNYGDYEIVVLPMHHSDEQQGYSTVTNGTAYEFIRLIRDSEFVVTDSFHASVFSFLFDKEFYVLPRSRKDEDEKFNDLVQKYGLSSHIIQDETTFERILDTDYSAGKAILQEDRKKAYRFLKEAIGIDS